MRKLPSYMWCGPMKINIEYPEIIHSKDEGIEGDDNELYGVAHVSDSLVKVSTKYTVQRQELSLLHELTHVYDEIYSLGLKERQVEKIAFIMYELFVRNELKLGGGENED